MKKDPYGNLHQMEFDLRCMQNLRYGFACSGDWEWVLKADAVIAGMESALAAARKRLEAKNPPRKRGK